MNRSLLTLGLCLISHSLIALEIQQADHVHKTSLPNGIKVYIEDHPSADLWGSFKVVFKHPSLNHTLYSFDSQKTEWDSLEDFFLTCAEKAQQSTDSAFALHQEPPVDIAVIAVGDFSAPQMLDLIEEQFSQITLNKTPSNESICIDYSDALHQVAMNVTLPNLYPPIQTSAHLKECWKSLLLQELFQQRFEECIRSLNETWIHPHPQNFYPITGIALVSENAAENTLAFLLWHLQMLKEQGFYADSFNASKRQLLHKLHYLTSNANTPDPTFLSSYYKDQFLLGDYCYNHQDFLSASLKSIEEIQLEDLLPLLTPFLETPDRKIHITYPRTTRSLPLTQERIEELSTQVEHLVDLYLENENDEDCPSFLSATPGAKDWIRKTQDTTETQFLLANNTQSNAFYQLPLSSREMDLIDSIISTMAKDNLIQLALNRRAIEKKGKKIEHVHPLRFMGHILSSRSLKDNARTIKKSSFKWDAFIDGFGKRMKEELARDNVYQYIPGFAQAVGSTPEHINHYIQKKDWEGLVKSLL